MKINKQKKRIGGKEMDRTERLSPHKERKKERTPQKEVSQAKGGKWLWRAGLPRF